jgi:hypothetical protein
MFLSVYCTSFEYSNNIVVLVNASKYYKVILLYRAIILLVKA